MKQLFMALIRVFANQKMMVAFASVISHLIKNKAAAAGVMLGALGLGVSVGYYYGNKGFLIYLASILGVILFSVVIGKTVVRFKGGSVDVQEARNEGKAGVLGENRS